jgi:purine nucleosidase
MRLIIDTDTAGDDAFSILLALRQPGVTLEALTICNGNVPFDQQVENALITLEMARRGGSVPVYPGCRLPILRKPLNATYVFGADGMSDANFPRATQRPEAEHAVDAIVDLVMANPGEITILAQALSPYRTGLPQGAAHCAGDRAPLDHGWNRQRNRQRDFGGGVQLLR